MSGIALVTGADRGLGFSLADQLASQGWTVFAGQFAPDWPDLRALRQKHGERLRIIPLNVGDSDSVRSAATAVGALADRVDLLINSAGVISDTSARNLREPQDFAEMHRQFDINSLGPLRVCEAFLALTDRSEMKRLAFVSSEAGSIGRTKRTSWYGYCMSKAALNMAVAILFNHLRPEGYTFRLYHPGFMRSYMHGYKNTTAKLEPDEAAGMALRYFLGEQDESRLVLRDYEGQEWIW
jgi:NAD(P)-dependent dehydrogenase (short-subunit alcohol dehydrogenase family)